MSKEKFFVDTSVVRPLETSSTFYKEYLNSQLEGEKYISKYIHKEFIMGLIIPMMNFYSTLRFPHIKSTSDALNLWNNKFSNRELKAIITLITQLLTVYKFDLNDVKNKDKASYIIADYINKLYRLFSKRYKFIGQDNNLCIKLKHKYDYNLDELDSLYSDYIKKFKNKDDVKKCQLSNFVKKNKEPFNSLTKKAKDLKPKDSEKWIKIFDDLNKPSCMKCSKAGDTIISILCPKNMTIVHTDSSFDFLIPNLEKNKLKLKSEITYSNELLEKDK